MTWFLAMKACQVHGFRWVIQYPRICTRVNSTPFRCTMTIHKSFWCLSDAKLLSIAQKIASFLHLVKRTNSKDHPMTFGLTFSSGILMKRQTVCVRCFNVAVMSWGCWFYEIESEVIQFGIGLGSSGRRGEGSATQGGSAIPRPRSRIRAASWVGPFSAEFNQVI